MAPPISPTQSLISRFAGTGGIPGLVLSGLVLSKIKVSPPMTRSTGGKVIASRVNPGVTRASTLLQGKKVTKELIETVADAAAKISHPLDNADMDYWYRKRMAKVYTQRALAQVAGLGN